MTRLIIAFQNFVNAPNERLQVILNSNGLIVSPAVTHNLFAYQVKHSCCSLKLTGVILKGNLHLCDIYRMMMHSFGTVDGNRKIQ
jgi:hypothetical protein